MRVRGSSVRRVGLVIAVTTSLGLSACSGDDDSTDGTLAVIDGSASATATTAPPSGATAVPGTGADPGTAGAGFVSIGVQVASDGIAETISLDRSTVSAASLDPVSLDASCTPLDGGDPAGGVVVSVVDLRRLAGSRLVSAVLRYGDPAPGEHDMTLELGSADQVASTYSGTVTVAPDGMSGTFTGADSGGKPASGSFACAVEAIATTTTAVPLDAGEEVPEGSAAP